ncbi:putative protein YjcS [Bacillus amyloliquefaciens]|nr:putative protein YjcS [Bacillus amyloliquefaciens]
MHYITACLKIISDKDLNEIMKEFKNLRKKRTKKKAVFSSMLIRLNHQNAKLCFGRFGKTKKLLKSILRKSTQKTFKNKN